MDQESLLKESLREGAADDWKQTNKCARGSLCFINGLVMLLGLCVICMSMAIASNGQAGGPFFNLCMLIGCGLIGVGLVGVCGAGKPALLSVYYVALVFLTISVVWITAYATFNWVAVEQMLEVKFEKHWASIAADFPASWKAKLSPECQLETKVAMADVTVCWGSIKGMVVEYVHVAAGLLGFCALLLLACLGLTTSALGMRGPRLVKAFMDVPIAVLGALLLFFGIFGMFELQAETKWVALPATLLGGALLFMGTIAGGLFVNCCGPRCCGALKEKLLLFAVVIYSVLTLAVIAGAVACLAYSAKVEALVEANFDTFCDATCLGQLRGEWDAAAKANGMTPTDASTDAEVHLEIKNTIKSNLNNLGWGLILTAMYLATEVACCVADKISNKPAEYGGRSNAPQISYGSGGR